MNENAVRTRYTSPERASSSIEAGNGALAHPSVKGGVPAWFWPAAAALLLLALGLRCLALGVDGFWLDEVFGATYTNLSMLDIVTAVLRFDIHPPFYYLQLKAWSTLGHSDAWLLANSIAWSLGTVALGGWAASRLAGPVAGLATVAVLAALGSEIHFASELRMYAMISCLSVAGWIRADIWSSAPTRRNAAWLGLVLCLLALTHSAAFVPVSAVLGYALIACQIRCGVRNRLGQALGLVAATGAVLLPCLVNASFRSVSHTVRPTFESAVQTISGWATGYGALTVPPALSFALGLAVLAFLAGALVFGNTTVRLILACFVAWPIITLFSISVTLRPLWIERAVAFCAPFFVIGMMIFLKQLLAVRSQGREWTQLGVASAAALALASVAVQQSVLPRKMQYREAAAFLAHENTARLPVYVPANVTFWGIARYLQGPEWGSLLEVQDPVRPDESDTWTRIYGHLGQAWLQRLHLVPATRQLATPAGLMWIGLSPLPAPVVANGLWVVGNNNLLKEAAPCGAAARQGVWRFTGVVVVKCGETAQAHAG